MKPALTNASGDADYRAQDRRRKRGPEYLVLSLLNALQVERICRRKGGAITRIGTARGLPRRRSRGSVPSAMALGFERSSVQVSLRQAIAYGARCRRAIIKMGARKSHASCRSLKNRSIGKGVVELRKHRIKETAVPLLERGRTRTRSFELPRTTEAAVSGIRMWKMQSRHQNVGAHYSS